MKDFKDYIESGILEMYVLGQTTSDENQEIDKMAALHEEVREEIDSIRLALEQYADSNSLTPPALLKPMLMATIDYTTRLQNGEQPTFPPMLHEGSKISDFEQWLNRKDLYPAEDFNIYASIIGYTPEASTAIIWVKGNVPPETHTDEHERFLIVEGTCDLIIDKEVFKLKAGDMMSIPLYKSHEVRVTSIIPCKFILQRAAA